MVNSDNTEIDFFRKSELWNEDWEGFLGKIAKGQNKAYRLISCLIEGWERERLLVVSGCLLFEMDKTMTLFHLFTLSEYRGKGYAKRTVTKAINIFEKSSACVLLAGTIKGSFVYEFFRKMGFEDLNPAQEGKDIVIYYARGKNRENQGNGEAG